MNKITKSLIAITVASLSIIACTKNTIEEHYTFYRPVYKTKTDVLNNIKSLPAQPLQKTGKLFIKGNYVFLNELNKGVHIIDYTNAATPQNIGFIDIPGNIDIAVRGNTMYADCYTDLITIDITNPSNVVRGKVIPGVFPHRIYDTYVADTSLVITEWVRVDTVVSGRREVTNWGVFTTTSPAAMGTGAAPANGVGGSMARFALLNNRLYTVGQNELNIFNTTTSNNPVFTNTVSLPSWDIETIFPFKDKLFIGSSAGMYIYNVTTPDNPVQAGTFTHARVCDPVIADNNYAYVTLRSGGFCAGINNQLDVVFISNIMSPTLVKSYPLTNPHGLSKDGGLLFICDGTDGLKIFNANDVNNIIPIKQFNNLETYDVIAYNGIALLVAKDGIYFIDYTNAQNIIMRGHININ